MKMRLLGLLIALALLPSSARAEVKPNAICSDGMVLQQKSSAKIWGTAAKGETVSVEFRDAKSAVIAEADGRWVVSIDTGAAGGPFVLTITGNQSKQPHVFKNVLVGEVWVCSGQSNMQWTVNGCDKTDQEYAKSAAPNVMLRMFTVKQATPTQPQLDTSGSWVEAAPNTVGNFSATGYFFGRALQESLKVPVGIINTSVGGTRIEAWMSQSALEALGVKDNQPRGANTASALYNGMVHPILNYRVKGAIWYQGESNAGNAHFYRTLHPAMIENWRADFKNPDMPFYIVQLAPYMAVSKKPEPSSWAELREAQLMTALKVKNSGLAVITDFGDEADIHPAPKRYAGERLALWARARDYGEKIVYSGPIYQNVKFDGAKAVLSFDHVGGGLVSKELVSTPSRNVKVKDRFAWRVKEGSANAPLTGFTVAGKDKVFHAAKAEIVGNTVVVTCDAVAEPVAVRYGWANHPICSLYNREGLPASPFRTDSFPGVTDGKK